MALHSTLIVSLYAFQEVEQREQAIACCLCLERAQLVKGWSFERKDSFFSNNAAKTGRTPVAGF